ncbi:hypothetical protein [Bacteroides sp.]|uniref:hypothetical protein n=1 Tax=Bacteroides sp. TaxID=29523 RepID=UPI003AB8A8F1
MERDIISIEEKTVIVTGYDVWMTAAEIAELFNVGGAQVNHAIKKLLKNDVLRDYEVCKYIHLNEKCSVDVYSMEVIISLSFQWDTYYTNVFRKWLVRKAVSEKKVGQPIFIQCGKGFIC